MKKFLNKLLSPFLRAKKTGLTQCIKDLEEAQSKIFELEKDKINLGKELEIMKAVITLTQKNSYNEAVEILLDRFSALVEKGVSTEEVLASAERIIEETKPKILTHRFATPKIESNGFMESLRPYEETEEFADKVELYVKHGVKREEAYRLAKEIRSFSSSK